jgi:hypothetical protein
LCSASHRLRTRYTCAHLRNCHAAVAQLNAASSSVCQGALPGLLGGLNCLTSLQISPCLRLRLQSGLCVVPRRRPGSALGVLLTCVQKSSHSSHYLRVARGPKTSMTPIVLRQLSAAKFPVTSSRTLTEMRCWPSDQIVPLRPNVVVSVAGIRQACAHICRLSCLRSPMHEQAGSSAALVFKRSRYLCSSARCLWLVHALKTKHTRESQTKLHVPFACVTGWVRDCMSCKAFWEIGKRCLARTV